MYEDLSFKRGYIITDSNELDPPREVDDWNADRLTDHSIYSHPALPQQSYSQQGLSLAIVGRVVDPIGYVSDVKEILATLHQGLMSSCKEFYDYLDNLTGRFVLLADGGDNSFVVQDASGNLSLFYEIESDRSLMASHPGLIATIGDHEVDLHAQNILDSKASYFPGLSTPHSCVKILTPNTLLELPSLDVTRFFPRDSVVTRDLSDDLLKQMATILKNSAELLNENQNLSFSLTSGIDSRLSLAATKEISDDVRYFTWAGGDPGSEEVSAVRTLCNNIGIDIEVVELDQPVPTEFVDVFMNNMSGMSIFNRSHTAFNFHREFDGSTISIRSNVAEIARTFYRDQFAYLPDETDSEILAKLYGYDSHSDYVVGAFEEFISKTEFVSERMYNYDPYDLFYWEHRMGCWLSLFLLEFSTGLDEFILYNNRKLLRLMLSVNYKERKSNNLFRKLISTLWNECLESPVNPHQTAKFPGSDELMRYIKGGLFRLPQPLYAKMRTAYTV